MDIKYIGINDANIEGRYNDLEYFITKIVSLENEFLSTMHIDHVVYDNTDEFDSIKVIPYQKGVVFEINNTADENEFSNHTEAMMIVSEDKLCFVITKADWNHNRNSEVEQQSIVNTDMANDLIDTLGTKLETDRVEQFEESKEWLLKFAQRRQEKIQRRNYKDIMSKTFNRLKNSINLFQTDDSLKSLHVNQEQQKQTSDQKEQLKKQIESIPDDQMEVLYQYSIGALDKMAAIKQINAINDKKDEPKVSEEQVKDMLEYVLQGNIFNKDDSNDQKQ